MNTVRKTIAGVALAGAALTGGAVGATLIGGTANAAVSPTTATTSTAATDQSAPAAPEQGAQGAPDPSRGGHQANGITEELLTGDTATKATAAAEAAVPGGTVERVETDAEGATYEAHMTKADGSHVTVKLDADFKVTATEEGHG